jgi:acetyltransferase-like isoleucine patch superfamily enzyme/2-polyprenyl-3-methyl-5-hydroxy-6-metoxy-1,4-benzoquinol methylase
MVGTKAQLGASVRCSIILTGGNDSSKLGAYLRSLSEMEVAADCEYIVVYDKGLKIDERQLEEFLPRLQIISAEKTLTQQQLFDRAAMIARGKFLLFVKNLITFDKFALEEAIEDLENSVEKVSISANANFVLIEKSYYASVEGFEGLFTGADLTRKSLESTSSGQTSYFRNLRNQSIPFNYSSSTFIDPEVIIESPKSVKIGSNCTIQKGVVLRPEGGEIVIGDNCVIKHYCIFHGKGGIYLGDWTIVDPHCGFYAHNQTYESFDVPITKQPSTGKGIYLMGDNWIGGHSVVCDNITIGKGAVVGANSTVTKSIPMASLAVGYPAMVVKKRYSESWNFHERERATWPGMPHGIYQHVKERAVLLKELLDTKDSILDVGCGEGIITAILADKTSSIIGCDYSVEAIETAKERHAHIEFVFSNSTNLEFADGSFTAVTMSDVAEHLMPIQFVRTLEEINRVLKRGGKLLLATPITGKGTRTSKYAHIYEYSVEELKEILRRMFCNVKLVNKKFGVFVAHKE